MSFESFTLRKSDNSIWKREEGQREKYVSLFLLETVFLYWLTINLRFTNEFLEILGAVCAKRAKVQINLTVSSSVDNENANASADDCELSLFPHGESFSELVNTNK